MTETKFRRGHGPAKSYPGKIACVSRSANLRSTELRWSRRPLALRRLTSDLSDSLGLCTLAFSLASRFRFRARRASRRITTTMLVRDQIGPKLGWSLLLLLIPQTATIYRVAKTYESGALFTGCMHSMCHRHEKFGGPVKIAGLMTSSLH